MSADIRHAESTESPRAIRIPSGSVTLEGELHVPSGAAGVVLFAHGSGSSRHSPRNRFVAEQLRKAGLGKAVGAVVSRGGRPDLAGGALRRVKCPTLLIVGELDETVITLNEEAYELLACEKDLQIVRRASHLFEEPGALEEVARLACDWFLEHLGHVTSSGRFRR